MGKSISAIKTQKTTENRTGKNISLPRQIQTVRYEIYETQRDASVPDRETAGKASV